MRAGVATFFVQQTILATILGNNIIIIIMTPALELTPDPSMQRVGESIMLTSHAENS